MSNEWEIYDLPKAVLIDGEKHEIRSDFRPILDIFMAYNDPELKDNEKTWVALKIFYPDIDRIKNLKTATELMLLFLNCGKSEIENNKNKPYIKHYDWKQDFPLIIAPINRIAKTDIRELEYLHFWSFISMFNEIGECLFSHVLNIRNKLRKSKKLEKWEKQFYEENRDIIDMKEQYSEENEAVWQMLRS